MLNSPKRKRNRLQEYDYSNSGFYFITICIRNRNNFFCSIKNGNNILNDFGKIVEKRWKDLPSHYKNCELDFFIIMPDHIHGIVMVNNSLDTESKNHSLSEIIRGFKTFSSKEINQVTRNEAKFQWQKSFYDRIIRNEKELYEIRKYIEQNPTKWDIEKNNPENLLM